jgi:hypothetical protein
MLRGRLDLVLIDDIHIFSQVYAELEAIMPFMAEEGVILLHDAFNYGVHNAIVKFLGENEEVRDCGMPCISPQLDQDPWTPYGGMQMLQIAPKRGSVMKYLENLYVSRGQAVPKFTPDILNHDLWYCKAGSPCDRCRRIQEGQHRVS